MSFAARTIWNPVDQKLSRSGLVGSIAAEFALAMGYLWNSRVVESDASVLPSSPATMPVRVTEGPMKLPSRPWSPTPSVRIPTGVVRTEVWVAALGLVTSSLHAVSDASGTSVASESTRRLRDMMPVVMDLSLVRR